MKIIYLFLTCVALIFAGCWHPSVNLVNMENPENERCAIYDDKDSINISGRAAYLYFFDQVLNVEIGIIIENNSMDTLLITNQDSLISNIIPFIKEEDLQKQKMDTLFVIQRAKGSYWSSLLV